MWLLASALQVSCGDDGLPEGRLLMRRDPDLTASKFRIALLQAQKTTAHDVNGKPKQPPQPAGTLVKLRRQQPVRDIALRTWWWGVLMSPLHANYD